MRKTKGKMGLRNMKFKKVDKENNSKKMPMKELGKRLEKEDRKDQREVKRQRGNKN